jgi:hypothetical protein
MSLDFRNFPEPFGQGEIALNLAELGYPANWTAADDLALVEGAFKYSGFLPVAINMRRTYDAVTARWADLRRATVGGGAWSITAQRALMDAVKARAEAQ